MAGAEPRVVAGLLEGVVEISVNEELDSFFNRYLVTADRPVSLRFLTGVEPVDVDEHTVTVAEAFPQHVLVGERAFKEGDVAEREERLGSGRVGIAGEDPRSEERR